MRALHPGRGLAYLCQLLGKSRQAYYEGFKTKESNIAFGAIVADLAVEVRKDVKNEKLGTRKLLPLINEQLAKQGLSIGRDQLFDVLDSYGLKVRQRKRRKPRTTDNTHGFYRYPNLIKDKELKQSEQAWVSDITYIRVKERFRYLSLITDAWSRNIMGYCLYEDLSVEGPTKALLMAISNRLYPSRDLIHHSDQGVQYCAHSYVNILKTNTINISMASKGSPHENALAERVNGILKQEYGLGKVIESVEKARQMVETAVESYNCKRPHQSLQGQTPQQIHGKDKWKQDLDEGLPNRSRTKKEVVNVVQD